MTQCIFRLAGVLIVAVCFSQVNAQTFNGQGGIPVSSITDDPGNVTISSKATVDGIGNLNSVCSFIEKVTIDVTHTHLEDISIFLIAPGGEVLELTSGNGGDGDNYQITEFTDKATQSIIEGTPPYNGSFRPEGRQTNTTHPFPNTNSPGTFSFVNTFDSAHADGEWTLLINDCSSTGVGVLNAWSITFATTPVADAGPSVTLCAGHSIILTASGGNQNNQYLWNTGQTGPKITVKPTTDTEYTVTVTVDGCSAVDKVMVSIIPSPDADAGPDKVICAGDSVQLAASGGGQYQWSIGGNTPAISVAPTMTTNYIVIVKSDNGCTTQDDVTVMVYPVPSADAGADQTICAGETVLLSGAGGEAYVWSNGDTMQSISVQPLVTTTYQLTATNFYGCSETDTMTVFVKSAPSLSSGANDGINGETHPSQNDIATYSIQPDSGVTHYNWTLSGGGTIVSGQGTTEVTIQWNGSTGGDVCVSASNDCGISSPLCITVKVTPTSELIGQFDHACSTKAGSMDLSLIEACQDEEVNANYLGGESLDENDALAFILHDGNIPGGIIAWNITPEFRYGLRMSFGSTYFISAVAGDVGEDGWPQLNDACVYISEGTPVIFNELPKDFDVIVTPPICRDECNGVIEIKNSRNDLLYAFGNEIFSSNHIFNSACSGVLLVSIMNSAGCVVDSIVTVAEPELLQVDLGPDQNISFGDSVLLIATTSSDAIQFNWLDASACLICSEISVAPLSSTIYHVEISDINGCTATDEIEIHVNHSLSVEKNVFVPTVFTPNGDGINDVFTVKGSGDLASIKSFQVIDRWGNTVCELKNILPGNEGWDGTCHGSQVKTGVYVYLIRTVFTDGEEQVLHGDVTVMR